MVCGFDARRIAYGHVGLLVPDSTPMLLVAFALSASALLVPHRASTHAPRQQLGRRECLGLGLGLGLGGLASPLKAAAKEEEIEVYFGCGCFWHVQHEVRRHLAPVACDLCTGSLERPRRP